MGISTIESKDIWAYEEFKNLAINCGRTINRFIKTIITLSQKPNELISAASKDKAEAKGIYRLLKNNKLTEEVVLSSHKKQTLKNIKDNGEGIILCTQDTSDISYANLKSTVGLRDYCGDKNSKGLKVHTIIAVTPEGIVKGILDQQI